MINRNSMVMGHYSNGKNHNNFHQCAGQCVIDYYKPALGNKWPEDAVVRIFNSKAVAEENGWRYVRGLGWLCPECCEGGGKLQMYVDATKDYPCEACEWVLNEVACEDMTAHQIEVMDKAYANNFMIKQGEDCKLVIDLDNNEPTVFRAIPEIDALCVELGLY